MARTIALDVDGVVCNWWGGIIATGQAMGLRDELPLHPNWVTKWMGSGTAFYKVWDAIKTDREWWMNLKPIKGAGDSINFHVDFYITSRPIPPQWTLDWLNKNGFGQPDTKVRGTIQGENKLDVMIREGVDALVDDKPDTLEKVRACTNAKVACFLMDQAWNRMHDDGGWRIKSLNEVPTRIKEFFGGELGESPPPLPTPGFA